MVERVREQAGQKVQLVLADSGYCSEENLRKAAEVGERELMPFKKCLLCGVRISPMIGSSAGHRSHLEDLQLGAFTTQNRPGFIPIHLCFRAPRVCLRYEYFAALYSQLLSATLHIPADRTLAPAEAGQLALQAMEYTPCSMPLLRRRCKVQP